MAGRKDPFSRIPNELLDDERLTWKAKGILAYLCGKPDGWKVRIADIAARGQGGKHAIRTALIELRACGYAEYIQPRAKGKFGEGCWKVSDTPIFSPQPNFPHTDNPHTDNRHHSKKECSKTEIRKKETEETEETSRAATRGFSEEKPEIPSTWRPDSRTKERKLDILPMPDTYPTEREFDAFLESQDLIGITAYRPDLYSDLCRNKWHTWREDLQKWVRILHWKKYVAGLDARILEAHA